MSKNSFDYTGTKSQKFLKTLINGKRQVQVQRKPIENIKQIREQYETQRISYDETCEKLLLNNYAISNSDAQAIIDAWELEKLHNSNRKTLQDIKKELENNGYDVEYKGKELRIEIQPTTYIITESSEPNIFNVKDINAESEELPYKEIIDMFDKIEDEDDDVGDNKINYSDVLDWLREHDMAWDDYCNHFHLNIAIDIEDIPISIFDTMNWIGEHDTLYNDWLEYFEYDNDTIENLDYEDIIIDDIEVSKNVGKIDKEENFEEPDYTDDYEE